MLGADQFLALRSARTARPARAGTPGSARRRARRASRSAPRRRGPRRRPGRTTELTMMSAMCGKPCVRRTASAAPGPKRRQRVAADDLARVQPVSRAPPAPSTTGPCSSLRTSTKPMPGWLASVRSSAGCRSSICSSDIRPGTSGKETRPRLPEARTTGSERRDGARSPSSGPPPGLCSAARTAARASAPLRVRPARRGTGSPQPARTRSSEGQPVGGRGRSSPGLWPWSDSSDDAVRRAGRARRPSRSARGNGRGGAAPSAASRLRGPEWCATSS